MIGFAVSFLAWTVSTLTPAFLGLLFITWVGKRLQTIYVLGFAIGIFLWFFVDTIGGSALLDVNSGFGGGAAQVGVVALFIVGGLLFFWIDRTRGVLSPESVIGKYGLMIPLLAAVAVGIHGLGEGAAYGATAYTSASASLTDAFGGLTAGVAYVLHKGLEPMMIGACYTAYYRNGSRGITSWLRDVLVLSIVFVIPSLIGAVTGYFYVYDTTYGFALGTGTSIYVILRLAGPLFTSGGSVNGFRTFKVAIALVLGTLAIYFAALFHS